MASTGYDYSIRKGLQERGVDNSQIGWNPATKSVTVGGRDFMRADRNYSNSAFTSRQNFNTAWDNYNKAKQSSIGTAPVPDTRVQTSVGTPPIQPGQQPWNQQRLTDYVSNPALPDNRYTPQIDQQIQALLSLANSQKAVNPYETAQYAAYQAQANRRANQGIRAAQEALGAAGFGRSTALGERAQGIQNAEAEYLETQVIPQIIAAEEARRQQQFNNAYSLLDPLFNQQGYMDNRAQAERGNAYDALNLLLSEDQRAIDNRRNARLDNLEAALRVGDATGRLINPQEEWSGLFRQGSDVGTPLNLAGQREQLNQANTLAALTGFLPNGMPTTQQQQIELENLWAVADATGVIPDQLADLYGIPRGTQTQAAKEFAISSALDSRQLDISEQNANTSRMNAERLQNDTTPTDEQTAADLRTYFDSMVQRNESGQITNPIDLERAILNAPISDYDAYQLYLRYGLDWKGDVPQPGN